MTYTPDDITAYIAQRVAAVGEDSKDVRILRQLLADSNRLDFLDQCNAALNAKHGTHYGWTMVMNHNVNRIMTEKRHLAIDLNDMEAHGAPSCRLAIDKQIARIGQGASAALSPQEKAHD